MRKSGFDHKMSAEKAYSTNPICWARSTKPRISKASKRVVSSFIIFLGLFNHLISILGIVIDRLRSYPAAKAKITELAKVQHGFVNAAARLNNRAEDSHRPTREREHRMRGFRDAKCTQEFLSCFGSIRQHFALKRHLPRASFYRKQLAALFVAWREFVALTQDPSSAS